MIEKKEELKLILNDINNQLVNDIKLKITDLWSYIKCGENENCDTCPDFTVCKLKDALLSSITTIDDIIKAMMRELDKGDKK